MLSIQRLHKFVIDSALVTMNSINVDPQVNWLKMAFLFLQRDFCVSPRTYMARIVVRQRGHDRRCQAATYNEIGKALSLEATVLMSVCLWHLVRNPSVRVHTSHLLLFPRFEFEPLAHFNRTRNLAPLMWFLASRNIRTFLLRQTSSTLNSIVYSTPNRVEALLLDKHLKNCVTLGTTF